MYGTDKDKEEQKNNNRILWKTDINGDKLATKC